MWINSNEIEMQIFLVGKYKTPSIRSKKAGTYANIQFWVIGIVAKKNRFHSVKAVNQ